MLDLKLLRDNLDTVAEKLLERGVQLDKEKFIRLESERKQLQVETQRLQNERNQRSKAIGIAKKKGEDISPLLQNIDELGQKLELNKHHLEKILDEQNTLLLSLPNLAHDSVPYGKDENGNIEIRRWGEPKKFDFTPLSHDELGKQLNLMDFNLSAKLTGSRFVVLKRELVRLHRAIALFMLDIHTQNHGYEEVYVPFIVNRDSLLGTGQLPKMKGDLFKLEGEQNYYLTPTGEVPVANFLRQELLDENTLPKKWVTHTPCFRSEAGSYGKDTKGMIRQHQFEKVELIWATKKEDSYQALEDLTSHAEAILQALELPYRVVSLCTGDIGFTAAKTYDLEVWLPSQNTYREISSCSNCEDFQARRMQARFKGCDKETEFVHTLNGSGLAVGRTLVAIMENCQDIDGNIHIPIALQSYMNGQSIIKNA